MEGIAYNDNSSENEGDADFRTDGGVDIVKGNGGRVIGYTVVGEWILYTVTVETEQIYYWTAYVSSGVTGSAFRIYMGDTDITGRIQVPRTGNNSWDTYTQISGETAIALPAGTYQLRLAIEGTNCNIDKIIFNSEPVSANSMKIDKFEGEYEVISMLGVSRGIVKISNGDVSQLYGMFPKGIYILRKQDGSGEARRIAIQ